MHTLMFTGARIFIKNQHNNKKPQNQHKNPKTLIVALKKISKWKNTITSTSMQSYLFLPNNGQKRKVANTF